VKSPAATTDTPPTVFVVDDDVAVRSALKLLLQSVNLRATCFATATEFLEQFDQRTPGCAVLDVRMPGMSGLELQDELNRRGAMLPVIFITGHGDVPMAVEALQHGAFDFLQKPFRDQELLDRIQRALQKDRENRSEILQREDIRARLASLTPREREVLDLMTSGRPNKLMAADLNLSQRTIEIHRARVMEKMKAPSLAQLVRMKLDVE
jgi:FixJ family two-component response regulator